MYKERKRAAEDVPDIDRYHFYNNLQITELVMLSGILVDYDFWTHIPSDIAVDAKFLPSEKTRMQGYLDNICEWSSDSKVKLNEAKSNFIIFTRSQTEFTLRLSMNYQSLKQVNAIRMLGIWICEDMSWQKNTGEACRKAYSHLSLITKLRYV